MPLQRCPHCGQRGIRWASKTSASPARPARCRECGGLSYSPYGVDLLLVLVFLAVALGGIVAALWLQSGWGLLVWPLGFSALIGLSCHTPLAPSNSANVERAQARARWLRKLGLWALLALLAWVLMWQIHRG